MEMSDDELRRFVQLTEEWDGESEPSAELRELFAKAMLEVLPGLLAAAIDKMQQTAKPPVRLADFAVMATEDYWDEQVAGLTDITERLKFHLREAELLEIADALESAMINPVLDDPEQSPYQMGMRFKRYFNPNGLSEDEDRALARCIALALRDHGIITP